MLFLNCNVVAFCLCMGFTEDTKNKKQFKNIYFFKRNIWEANGKMVNVHAVDNFQMWSLFQICIKQFAQSIVSCIIITIIEYNKTTHTLFLPMVQIKETNLEKSYSKTIIQELNCNLKAIYYYKAKIKYTIDQVIFEICLPPEAFFSRMVYYLD